MNIRSEKNYAYLPLGASKMKSELIKRLRGLANGSIKPTDKSEGICEEINRICERSDLSIACMGIIEAYPEGSGWRTYPIPHPTLSPQIAFNVSLNLWDKRTIYGKRRLAMCDYVADKLEEMK